MSPRPITVLLIDDSSFIRNMMQKILTAEEGVTVVAQGANGQDAIDLAGKHKPDIVVLDIEMPVMDGVAALPKILEASPGSKVVMCSTLTVRNGEITLKALELGATECIAKPTSNDEISGGTPFQTKLVQIVKSLGRIVLAKERTASIQAGPHAERAAQEGQQIRLSKAPNTYVGAPALIAIGSSTGGPQALFKVIKHFKGLRVPIILTQHMPATFTKILAQHIEQNTGVMATEGEDGMALQNGKVLVAPGGFHMLLEKNGPEIIVRLDDSAPINFCKPAVDPMFESALKLYGNRMLGVILTGMGNDGLKSAKKLVQAGGRLVGQDEATSVVWGMPGAVATAGLCTAVLPVDEIGPWVLSKFSAQAVENQEMPLKG